MEGEKQLLARPSARSSESGRAKAESDAVMQKCHEVENEMTEKEKIGQKTQCGGSVKGKCQKVAELSSCSNTGHRKSMTKEPFSTKKHAWPNFLLAGGMCAVFTYL